MKSFLYHIQVNVSDAQKCFPFYKELLTLMGYTITLDETWGFGASNSTTDLWVVASEKKYQTHPFHRKNVGLNHLSFGVGKREDVEEIMEKFLTPRGIKPLYDSPREYPEYGPGYYAVFFEDPDRVKIEITYKPDFEDKV